MSWAEFISGECVSGTGVLSGMYACDGGGDEWNCAYSRSRAKVPNCEGRDRVRGTGVVLV